MKGAGRCPLRDTRQAKSDACPWEYRGGGCTLLCMAACSTHWGVCDLFQVPSPHFR